MAIDIKNPIITNNTFGIWWIQSLIINQTSVIAEFVPSNGEYNLSVRPSVMVVQRDKMTSDTTFTSTISNALIEIKRQYIVKNPSVNANTLTLKNVSVSSDVPSDPVRVVALFDENGTAKPLLIPDAYKLAETDTTWGNVLASTISEIGRQGKIKNIIS